MSWLSNYMHEIGCGKRRAQGAFASHRNTMCEFTAFARFMRTLGIKPRRVKDTPEFAILLYIQHCVARGIAPGTVRNTTTEIRCALRRAGRNIDYLTNAAMGISSRDRNGQKRALLPPEVDEFVARAARLNMGFALLLLLQRLLGLRRLEGLRSAPDLQLWLDCITAGDHTVPVTRGVKGGRPRAVTILMQRREETIRVLRSAVQYCHVNDGQLITGRRDSLESALNRLKAMYTTIGMKGETSSHAMRYTFAQEKALEYLQSGMEEHAVLVHVSADLGHGPSRQSFTARVYLRGIFSHFSRIMQGSRFMGCARYLIEVFNDLRDPNSSRKTRRKSGWIRK
ncbi:integrase [Paraburkholderia sp. 1N]|uniref:Integrase n=1 Tax=Paraburkholderia solitsugae TaxID=2675748 RepID=A0ABX2C1Y3_9BURK|nr:integrase domain-containing protein [Paraburkholderia solitsugae]NPT42380.1 integrase [Paraburkholderia solitsugae]NPT46263.1 integrase [Paraburkholderia solitsugae]